MDTRRICPPCTEKWHSSGATALPAHPASPYRCPGPGKPRPAGSHPLHDPAIYLHPVPVHGWRGAVSLAEAASMGSRRGPKHGEPSAKQPRVQECLTMQARPGCSVLGSGGGAGQAQSGGASPPARLPRVGRGGSAAGRSSRRVPAPIGPRQLPFPCGADRVPAFCSSQWLSSVLRAGAMTTVAPGRSEPWAQRCRRSRAAGLLPFPIKSEFSSESQNELGCKRLLSEYHNVNQTMALSTTSSLFLKHRQGS